MAKAMEAVAVPARVRHDTSPSIVRRRSHALRNAGNKPSVHGIRAQYASGHHETTAQHGAGSRGARWK